MQQRAIWISIWMTVTYWLGGAFGCSAPQPQQPSAVDQLIQRIEAIRSKRLAATIEHGTAFGEPGHADPAGQGSLSGLDRSHWPKLRVSAEDGATPHGLILFNDLSIAPDVDEQDQRESELELDLSVMKLPASNFSLVFENAASVEVQILNAVQGVSAQKWGRSNRLHAVLQPMKAALDLVAMPYQYIQQLDQDRRSRADKSDTPVDDAGI